MLTEEIVTRYQQGPNNKVQVTAGVWYPGHSKLYIFAAAQSPPLDGYPKLTEEYWFLEPPNLITETEEKN